MKLSEINLRDPFVLPVGDTYYLYGTSACRLKGKELQMPVYSSSDLEDWQKCAVSVHLGGLVADRDFWAPDVFLWRGKYYMFLSCISAEGKRGTHVFVADSPTGDFAPVSSEPVTPSDRMCLDATLYVEDGVPYLLYSWEWLEAGNGKIFLCRLREDLAGRAGESVELFDAFSSGFSTQIEGEFRGERKRGYVTDSPLLYKSENGKYLLLWSTIGKKGYNIALAESDRLYGKYTQQKLLFDGDGGHAMLFETFKGEKKLSFHVPNNSPDERPCFRTVRDTGRTLEI